MNKVPMIFTAKQKEYIREAKGVWNFKVGAVRSGKTFIDTKYVIPANIRERAGKEGLTFILGVSESTIERNVLTPMRALYGTKLVGNISTHNEVRLFGERCYAFGMEKVSQLSKLQGASAKYVYGDEVAKWNKEAFLMLVSRLDKAYSRFDGSLNPESPYHYLKEFIDSDASIYRQHYTIDDNTFLDMEVKERIKRQYSGVYYKRYVMGEWCMAEGAIYDMYKDEKNLCDEIDIEADFYIGSVDYGTSTVCAFCLFGVKGNQIRLVKEYYYDAVRCGRQKTDGEYARDWAEFVNGYNVKYGYIDPSASSFRLALWRSGFEYLYNANNDVLDGIRYVQSKLSDGTFKISKGCIEARKQMSSYVWDNKSQQVGIDKPLKQDDHMADAMRYGIYSYYKTVI
jgi:PBSX family phage terminase large subunit